MSDKEAAAGRLGFLDPLVRLFRPREEAPPPEPQESGFDRLEADFDTALRSLREKVAEQAVIAGPVGVEHGRTGEDVAAQRKRRIEACHRAIREDIEKMHARLGTGLSPADLDSIGAVLRRLDADAAEGRGSQALLPRLRYSVATRLRLEAGALAVARIIALLGAAKLEWPDPTHYQPQAKPEEIERSRRRRLAEIRESFLAQDFGKTAERMLGVIQTWGADYPDRGSPLWEESVLEGVAAGIRGHLLKDFVDLVEQNRDLVLSRTEAAIGKELAVLQTAVAGGVHSIEQADLVASNSFHALDEVVPELVWQLVRSLLPEARGEFAS